MRPQSCSDQRSASDQDDGESQVKIWQLINAYRSRGHQIADLDPLGYKPHFEESLDPASYGFTVWDLDRSFLAGSIDGRSRMTLREILASGESAFTVGVVAEKSTEALQTADDLLPRLRAIPGLEDVEMDRVMGNPTIEVTIDREKALRLLENKAGSKRFTPDAAAPYLKMLVADVPDSDFAKVWRNLSTPQGPDGWVCRKCDRRDDRIRWFCPSCLGFHTYAPGSLIEEGT